MNSQVLEFTICFDPIAVNSKVDAFNINPHLPLVVDHIVHVCYELDSLPLLSGGGGEEVPEDNYVLIVCVSITGSITIVSQVNSGYRMVQISVVDITTRLEIC